MTFSADLFAKALARETKLLGNQGLVDQLHIERESRSMRDNWGYVTHKGQLISSCNSYQ